MPELLENLLWCAALAAWLMLLGGFSKAIFWPRAKTIRLGSSLVRSALAASAVLATVISRWARPTSRGGKNGG